MSKRGATTDLNRDNCEVDDPPEEPGCFQQASDETMKKRVIRTARRRCAPTTQEGDATKNVFAGFSGFGQFSQAQPAKPSFSFLSSSSTTLSGSNGTEDQPSDLHAVPVNGTVTEATSKQTRDKEYYSKLRGLNESVSRWISTHVAKNPLCILTPVFKDYEKHLQAIESARQKDTSSEGTTEVEKKVKTHETIDIEDDNDSKTKPETVSSASKSESKSPSTPTFSFGASSPSIFAQSIKPTEGGALGGTLFGSASSPPSATLSFGMSSVPSAGFSFGGSSMKPFSFTNVSNNPETTESADNDDEPDEPPRPDHKQVTEAGAIYEKRCKVFVKKDGQFADRGIGNLFLKPVCEGEKTQLIVRADTSLGNILLNVLLSSALPTTRLGNNNVAIVCVPTPEEKPPPVTVLLRVKTSDDADELLATLERHKK